jgi:hypothetical protein
LEHPVNSKCKEYGIENIESYNLESDLFFICSPHPNTNEESCYHEYWSVRKKSYEWCKWTLESNEPAEEKGDGAIELEDRLEHSVWKYSEVRVRVNYLERISAMATTWTIGIMNMTKIWNRIASTIPPRHTTYKSPQRHPTSTYSTKSFYSSYCVATTGWNVSTVGGSSESFCPE